MIINKISKDKFKSCDDFYEYTKLSLIRMMLRKKYTTIECFIEWENGDTFLSDFVDIGVTALSEDLIVYTNLKNNESYEIFYLPYNELECYFIDEDDEGHMLRARIKFKDIRITFRYKYVNYKEYIKSEEWKHKRKQVLERDKFKCRLCGAKGTEYTLHIHHNSYDNLGNEPLEDLITLCKECHGIYHKS